MTHIRPQLNVSVRKRFDSHISARLELQYYNIGGSDAKSGDASRVKRNLNFHANNFEVSVCGQYDFVNYSVYEERYSRRRPFNIYGFAGFGITTNNPATTYDGKSVGLRNLQTEGKSYGFIQPVIPLGVGIRVKTGITTDVLIEAGYRITFTDYLDDVSSEKYKDPNTFTDPVARALSDRRGELAGSPYQNPDYAAAQRNPRGNPDKKDSYLIVSAKFQYTFTATTFNIFKRGLLRKGGYRARYPRYK